MKWTGVALTLGAVMMTATASAAAKSKAENGLLGVKLYDSGTRVVSLYGTPDQIDAVSIGGGAAGSGSPFGGRPGMGGPSSGAPQKGRPSMGSERGAPGFSRTGPFDFADTLFQSGDGVAGASSAGASQMADESGNRGGGGSFGPPGGGLPGQPSSGAPRGNAGSSDSVTYTRWIYNRNGSKYGFVFDKFNRVVQIEAIGLQNSKVKTTRGIGFGNTFAEIIKKYQAPDGYEISGDNVLVKYLSKSKVAFRLSRLGEKKPQVVTGVVVAAAKG